MMDEKKLRGRIRLYLWSFIIGLVLSGVTAFPLVWEINLLAAWLHQSPLPTDSALFLWLTTVQNALNESDRRFPFLFYGTDWLAFGHLIIALFFIGPLLDPVRNVFVIRVGIAACVLVWPLAFICGPIRGIPFFWQLIDCSFGVFGLIPLLLCLRDIRQLREV